MDSLGYMVGTVSFGMVAQSSPVHYSAWAGLVLYIGRIAIPGL